MDDRTLNIGRSIVLSKAFSELAYSVSFCSETEIT